MKSVFLTRLQKIKDRAEVLLFPPRCPVCDKVVSGSTGRICKVCRKKVKYLTGPKCFRCGKKLNDPEKEYCEDCRKRDHIYTAGRALYEYESIAPSLYRFKYQGRQEYGAFFAQELAYFLGDFIREIGPDGLIPVPMYPAKERRRGYNQAKVLALELGKQTGIPVYDGMVRRQVNTKALKLLNSEERLNNLKKAFIIDQNGVKLCKAIIIDDIYTTGSTIDSIAAVLRRAGCEEIYFLTLAIGAGV